MTLVKQLYGRETSNLQVKFYYRAASNNDIIDSTTTLYHVQWEWPMQSIHKDKRNNKFKNKFVVILILTYWFYNGEIIYRIMQYFGETK